MPDSTIIDTSKGQWAVVATAPGIEGPLSQIEQLPSRWHLDPFRAHGVAPTFCVVEPDSSRRKKILTEFARKASGLGATVIVADQSASDSPDMPSMPEEKALVHYLNLAQAQDQNSGPLLLVLPRLERPVPTAVQALRETRKNWNCFVVAGARDAEAGFAKGEPSPASFSVWWHQGMFVHYPFRPSNRPAPVALPPVSGT